VGNGNRVVITGGTRGLGKAMAEAFIGAGARVFITGRNGASVSSALAEIGRATGAAGDAIGGGAGDMGHPRDVERLAAEAKAFLGGVDHWINNAGVNQAPGRILDLAPEEMERVVRTDLLGPMYGARAASRIVAESGGFIWFMEGHGSNGKIIDGKRGVNYLWQALAAECGGGGIRIGALSPGIMVTDFILEGREGEDRAKREKNEKVYNILGDRPETVAAFFVPRILAATRNGEKITWLTPRKAAWRFMTAGIARRKIIG
jgi:NAD(P)-dependent dehydrogenase (short-subunit alcohol dehydrogenase family)